MIAVMVRFQYENEFNEARLQQIAEGARSKFVEGLKSFLSPSAFEFGRSVRFGESKTRLGRREVLRSKELRLKLY